RKQAQLLSLIADSERQPDYTADKVYRSLAYGKHPYGRPSYGRREIIAKLAPGDCAAFYHQAFVPNNTLVSLVGDFDSQKVIDEITRLTADWKPASVTRPETPAVDKPRSFEERLITMPSAAQLHFYMGHPGIRRNNPD